MSIKPPDLHIPIHSSSLPLPKIVPPNQYAVPPSQPPSQPPSIGQQGPSPYAGSPPPSGDLSDVDFKDVRESDDANPSGFIPSTMAPIGTIDPAQFNFMDWEDLSVDAASSMYLTSNGGGQSGSSGSSSNLGGVQASNQLRDTSIPSSTGGGQSGSSGMSLDGGQASNELGDTSNPYPIGGGQVSNAASGSSGMNLGGGQASNTASGMYIGLSLGGGQASNELGDTSNPYPIGGGQSSNSASSRSQSSLGKRNRDEPVQSAHAGRPRTQISMMNVVWDTVNLFRLVLGIIVDNKVLDQKTGAYMRENQVVPASDADFGGLLTLHRRDMVWMPVAESRLAYLNWPLSLMLCLKDNVCLYPFLRKALCLASIYNLQDLVNGDQFQFLVICLMDANPMVKDFAMKTLEKVGKPKKLKYFRGGFIRGRMLIHLQHMGTDTLQVISKALEESSKIIGTLATWQDFFETKEACDELRDLLVRFEHFGNNIPAGNLFDVWKQLNWDNHNMDDLLRNGVLVESHAPDQVNILYHNQHVRRVVAEKDMSCVCGFKRKP
jgi:hypothetical protein